MAIEHICISDLFSIFFISSLHHSHMWKNNQLFNLFFEFNSVVHFSLNQTHLHIRSSFCSIFCIDEWIAHEIIRWWREREIHFIAVHIILFRRFVPTLENTIGQQLLFSLISARIVFILRHDCFSDRDRQDFLR